MSRLGAAAASAALVGGCASTPRATISYPLTGTTALVALDRMVTCDGAGYPMVASEVVVTATHGADPKGARGKLDTSRLDSQFANSSLELNFGPDQRLQSINGESVGQGETILKSGVRLLASLAGLPGARGSESVGLDDAGNDGDAERRPAADPVCDLLTRRFGAKGVKVSHTARLAFDPMPADAGYTAPLKPIPDHEEVAGKLAGVLKAACVRAVKIVAPSAGVLPSIGERVATLDARQPAHVEVRVHIGSEDCRAVTSQPISSGVVPVGQLGQAYKIPIPAAAMFGKNTFVVQFGPDGALTKLSYGKEAGAGGAVAVAQEAANATQLADDAARAKAAQDRITRIRAEDQLRRCEADPSACE